MQPSPEVQGQILGFIIFSIPLIVALWKVFALLQGIEDRLENQIRQTERQLSDLAHQSQLRSTQMEALNDRLALAINGTKELVSHVRLRTQTDANKLSDRLGQLERFLSKTTDFEPRE